MTERDRLLRAAVYAAHDSRPLRPNDPLVQRVVDAVVLWPLIEYQHALERAKAQFEQRRQDDDAELLGWYGAIGMLDVDEEQARAA